MIIFYFFGSSSKKKSAMKETVYICIYAVLLDVICPHKQVRSEQINHTLSLYLMQLISIFIYSRIQVFFEFLSIKKLAWFKHTTPLTYTCPLSYIFTLFYFYYTYTPNIHKWKFRYIPTHLQPREIGKYKHQWCLVFQNIPQTSKTKKLLNNTPKLRPFT